jgi:hypothetical protein
VQYEFPDRDVNPRGGYRRLREDPITTLQRIAGEIGPRAATSLAEAKAAAYLDGRLRRSGMHVSADTFAARDITGRDGLLLGGLALLTALLFPWQAWPSLLLALWTVCVALLLVRRLRAPLLGPIRGSQNVVAIRAASVRARWRVVLLAPLDSPPILGRIGQVLLGDRARTNGQVAACLALALLCLVGLLVPAWARSLIWYVQFGPVAFLLGTALIETLAARRERSRGAVSHAGALAALLAVAETTEAVDRVELWVVALGATVTSAGVADLLRRYPFDRDTTLFIGLEGIGAGSLCFVDGGDAPRGAPADALLVEAAHAAGSEAASEAGPRSYRGGWSLAGLLRARGFRSIAVMCLDASGRVTRRGAADDTPEQVEPVLLENAARLVGGIVRRLDLE